MKLITLFISDTYFLVLLLDFPEDFEEEAFLRASLFTAEAAAAA